MGRLVFWICVIALVFYAQQNNWFAPIGNFFGMIKSDIEYQRNLVPKEEDEIDDGGILSIEKGESKIQRRSALGTVHAGR